MKTFILCEIYRKSGNFNQSVMKKKKLFKYFNAKYDAWELFPRAIFGEKQEDLFRPKIFSKQTERRGETTVIWQRIAVTRVSRRISFPEEK